MPVPCVYGYKREWGLWIDRFINHSHKIGLHPHDKYNKHSKYMCDNWYLGLTEKDKKG